MKSFNEFKKSFDKMFPWIINFLKWLFFLVFCETPRDLYNTFLKHWKESNSISEKFSTIFTWFIILSFILYWFFGLYNDFYNWKTKEWREEVVFKDYEQEIKTFLNKYNERFSSHDCDFMREVWADEAMYDKWDRTEYPKDSYSCEEFINYQNKFLIPLFISPIKKIGDKYKVEWKMLIVRMNQGESWEIKSVYFNLWKKLDWELWHFNNPKNWPRTISTKLLQ